MSNHNVLQNLGHNLSALIACVKIKDKSKNVMFITSKDLCNQLLSYRQIQILRLLYGHTSQIP